MTESNEARRRIDAYSDIPNYTGEMDNEELRELTHETMGVFLEQIGESYEHAENKEVKRVLLGLTWLARDVHDATLPLEEIRNQMKPEERD